ncbi:MAG: DNA adenine methylase [Polyangiaceae bacterium]
MTGAVGCSRAERQSLASTVASRQCEGMLTGPLRSRLIGSVTALAEEIDGGRRRRQAGDGKLPKPHPFLKWLGGKGRLLEQFENLLPPTFDRYFEPFFGGGAMFFSLTPPRAVLSDVNAELVDCYSAVRDSVENVIAALGDHRYEKAHFYEVRALDPRALTLPERAARTIFLNRAGFNGLYRVNRQGRFNVPFGRYTNPTLCDASNLRACSRALEGVEFLCGDFAAAVATVKRGDFVYFDPPYVPVSTTANFTHYAAGRFDWGEQERLAKLFAELSRRGVLVMLSNADTTEVRDLFNGFKIERVAARRSVNSNPEKRGKVGEVVVRNFGAGTRQTNGALVHRRGR